MASINDVSRLAQVSKATVSRVLSGSRGVKEQSREAVLRAVEILNYKPNAIAQSLSSQTTHCIGVICATEHMQQATGYLQALEKQLRLHQKHLLLRFANSSSAVAQACAELSTGLCDAIMVVGARFPLPDAAQQAVLIDCLDASGGQQVGIDYEFASQTATHYLLTQQRRKIALFNFNPGDAADQVLQGYCSALESMAMPFNRQLIMAEEPSASVALQELINRHIAFDALLVTDYYQGLEVADLLKRYQRAVPQEVMVFSLDGSAAAYGQPHLPLIAYPLETLAQRAIKLLSGGASDFPLLRGNLLTPY
ncbi:DNA-binding LacI/PurR family transcriptional regulator [Erwinia toletana]|uniref:DNA-binding LacI/PurR family transcriptional regulator n=1 Tax=Winslowiella toletana TaxID=92490 RepID=A0ABS4PFS5_9GAMM|nr:LacI family DNA-binding transcriptional regulator [Winslowiella toletana]MBP2171496.1 DNA-binding LacI/PurR family transcriptional regulator [Winslowiella toletana]